MLNVYAETESHDAVDYKLGWGVCKFYDVVKRATCLVYLLPRVETAAFVPPWNEAEQ
jgi:hypothetical protein